MGLETTLKRPIINTRDEPHADAERYRRLHVIIGDANISQVATFVKLGSTALLLAVLEDRGAGGFPSPPRHPVRGGAGLRPGHHARHGGRVRATTDSAAPGISRTSSGTWRAPTRRAWRRGRRLARRGGPDSAPLARDARRRARRPRFAWPTGWNGWPSGAWWTAIANATPWRRATPACARSTCSSTTFDPNDRWPRAWGSPPLRASRRFVKRFTTHRAPRGPSSAVAAWRSSPTRSWRPTGTRSSSTSARDRSSACR